MKEGTITRIGQPKLYKGGWGPNRRFFVLFGDGTKAMFSATHHGSFAIGDKIRVEGEKVDGEWMNVGEKATITRLDKTDPQTQMTLLKLEVGYVTKPREEAGRRFYLSYKPTIIEGEAANPPKVLHFPVEVVWHDKNNTPMPPAYSTITVLGEMAGDTLLVREIIYQMPCYREETVVVKMDTLIYHYGSADFYYCLGEEQFQGTIKTPFLSSVALNAIKDQFSGITVEIRGLWLKGGRFKLNAGGEWEETIHWNLWRGIENWNEKDVKTIKESVFVWDNVEEFHRIITELNSGSFISIQDFKNRLDVLGFDFAENAIWDFIWKVRYERDYVNFLKSKSQRLLVSPNRDEFAFILSNGATVFEIPIEGQETIVCAPPKGDWNTWFAEFITTSRRDIIKNRETRERLGVIAVISHTTEWESEILAALLQKN